MTIEEIRKNAPEGATHYFKNEWVVVYYVYCDHIELWLAYNNSHKHWSSAVFPYRTPLLKPL